jgi:hypothetical protein
LVSIAGKEKPFCSGGREATASSIEIGGNEFKTFGVARSQVDRQSETNSKQPTTVKTDILMIYFESISITPQPYRIGESFEEVKWRTLVAKKDMDGNIDPMEWGNVYRYRLSTLCQRRKKTWNLSKRKK